MPQGQCHSITIDVCNGVPKEQCVDEPQEIHVADRDRQIALLEQELNVQKMMMEVERREAIVREQASILTVQADRMRMEREQVIRLEVHKYNFLQCVLYLFLVILGHKWFHPVKFPLLLLNRPRQ